MLGKLVAVYGAGFVALVGAARLRIFVSVIITYQELVTRGVLNLLAYLDE